MTNGGLYRIRVNVHTYFPRGSNHISQISSSDKKLGGSRNEINGINLHDQGYHKKEGNINLDSDPLDFLGYFIK